MEGPVYARCSNSRPPTHPSPIHLSRRSIALQLFMYNRDNIHCWLQTRRSNIIACRMKSNSRPHADSIHASRADTVRRCRLACRPRRAARSRSSAVTYLSTDRMTAWITKTYNYLISAPRALTNIRRMFDVEHITGSLLRQCFCFIKFMVYYNARFLLVHLTDDIGDVGNRNAGEKGSREGISGEGREALT